MWVVILYRPHRCQGGSKALLLPGGTGAWLVGGKRGMWRVSAIVFHCPWLGEHFCL